MKKLALTVAIVLGLSLSTFAEYGGGLFQRGVTDEEFYGMGYANTYRLNGMPLLPQHGWDDNADAPLGTGIAVLTALGAVYLVGKKRKEE